MSWLRRIFARREIYGDLSAEIRAHLDEKVEELVAAGMPREEAEHAARRQFGNVLLTEEHSRNVWRWPRLEDFLIDIRYALRMLRKSPGFAAVALITLALATGANTAVFSVVESVLLKPLPYPHPSQLVAVWQTAPGAATPFPLELGPSNYFVYRKQNRVFQNIGLYEDDSVSVTGSGQPEQVRALDATQSVLPILGIPPAIGRWFSPQDDTPDAPETAMLTYGYWQGKFGGDPGVIGRTIVLDGVAHEIIGVMPERFHFLDESGIALILPLKLDRNHTVLGQFHYYGIARLKPGVTLAEANADLARLIPTVLRSFPAPPGYSLDLFYKLRLGPDVHPLRQEVVGGVEKLLWILMGGIGIVLLIACANVANLLLVRTDGRQHELAIRAALGATRRRIAAELLLESLVLGVAGSALGLVLAYGALRGLVDVVPSGLPRMIEIGIDGRVLLFSMGIAVVASLLFGSVPIFRYAGLGIGTRLREGGRVPGPSRRQHRARNILVTIQVALAFVLLVCSGLMIRTFFALTHVESGFQDASELQTFRVHIHRTQRMDAVKVLQIEQAIERKLHAIPGVSSVGFASSVPMGGRVWKDALWVADRGSSQGEVPPIRTYMFASPEYLRTMGIPLVAGRNFTWTETYNKAPVALISESLAREYWGEPAAAIGKRIRASNSDEWRRVIGVVGNVRNAGMNKPVCECVYWPLYNAKLDGNPILVINDVSFVVRTPRAGSQAFLGEVRRAVWSVDAELPLTDVHTMGFFYRKSMERTSFTLLMLGIAGGMALLLAILGLYGVIAYSVTQRTREIGVRAALGARPQELAGMFLRQCLLLAVVGVACGLVAALGVTRLLASLLFHVSSADPLTYAAATLGLVAAACVAGYVPARRAARVDPVIALRNE